MFAVRIARALVTSALFVCVAAAGADSVRVARVLDGDSLRLVDGREVRLAGINAPEFGKDGAPDEPLARTARERLTQLVEGKELRLELDTEKHDRYRRTLAYLSLPDDRRVDEEMLRAGLAFAIAQAPNLKYLESNLRAEAEARAARRGLWNEPYYRAREANTLAAADTGFRFVTGRIGSVGGGRTTIYLDLAPRVSIAIAREHWRYFEGKPERYIGRRVTARGWLADHGGRLRLRLSHPAMLEVLD